MALAARRRRRRARARSRPRAHDRDRRRAPARPHCARSRRCPARMPPTARGSCVPTRRSEWRPPQSRYPEEHVEPRAIQSPDRAGAVAARRGRARERRTRSAAPGRSASRARTPTATPSGRRGDARHRRVQPGARAAGVVARGRRGVAQADAARGAARAGARARRCEPPARTPEQNRSSFRAGDLVARIVPGREVADGPMLTVRASGPGGGRPRRARGRHSALPGELAPVAYGCPVCGQVQRSRRRAAGAQAVPASAWRSSCSWSAPSARSSRRCEASAHARARRQRDGGRARRLRPRGARPRALPAGPRASARRPREERRGRMLAAYAHAYALWAAGTTARDAGNVRAPT